MQQISKWMLEIGFKLNSGKTEVLIFGPNVSIGHPTGGTPATKAKNLGVIFDTKLSFKYHINAITSSIFFNFKNGYKNLPIHSPDTAENWSPPSFCPGWTTTMPSLSAFRRVF